MSLKKKFLCECHTLLHGTVYGILTSLCDWQGSKFRSHEKCETVFDENSFFIITLKTNEIEVGNVKKMFNSVKRQISCCFEIFSGTNRKAKLQKVKMFQDKCKKNRGSDQMCMFNGLNLETF